MIRTKLVALREKLLRPVVLSQQKISIRLDEIEKRQTEIMTTQAAILQRVEKRLLNSGVVQLPSGEIIAKIFSGAKMYLDPHDVAVVPHLVLDGDWERNVTKAWLNTVRAGDVVVDIGANFGYFGVLAAQQTNRQCKVVSFEANPNLIPYLKKTFNVNGFDGLSTIENLALADKAGTVSLTILENYIGSSSLHSLQEIKQYTNHSNPDIRASSVVKVNSISLDEYCDRNGIQKLDLIKMDIEGFEDKAYEGMRNIVRRSPGLTLFIEFTKRAYKDPARFYEKMLADFKYVFLINEGGDLYKPTNTDYAHVIDAAEDDWVMPVFSKKDLLRKRHS